MITKIHIQGFKTIADASLELGRVNLLVGASGSGKTNVLEALGLLGCAASGRVDHDAFRARGVRPGTPVLCKTALRAQKRLSRNITLEAESAGALYRVTLGNPIQRLSVAWQFASEMLKEGGRALAERSPRRSRITVDNAKPRPVKPAQDRGLGPLVSPMLGEGALPELLRALDEFRIYAPLTPMMRGTAQDLTQKPPFGLHGGGLAEGAFRLSRLKDGRTAPWKRAMMECVALIDWADSMRFDVSSLAPAGGLEPHVTLSFRDRHMMRDLGWLSAVDVNDGALHVALLITLVLHPETPRVVALDDVDMHLNPRLARQLIGRVQDILLDEPGRPQLILTTHNPLILDALKLRDERVRLFITFRDEGGATVVRRVPHSQAIEKAEEHGMSLSQLWLSGALHGVPNL